MAARLQPATAFHRRRLAVGVVALVALGVPAGAHAHGIKSVDALDFEARITAVAPRTQGVEATVVDGDRKLDLRVNGTHTVVVLGYEGEPFLRLSSAGVEVNRRSATAVILKLGGRGADPALSPLVPARWSPLAKGERYAWHDHRLGPTRGTSYGRGDVAGWAIPLIVDGKPDRITGRLWHASAPSFWPWLALLGAAIVVSIVVARRRNRRRGELIAVAAAGVSCLAALVLNIVLGVVPGRSTTVVWGTVAFSGVVALAAVAALGVARQARRPVAGVVGMFAALAGVGHVGVLAHGYVVAAVPALAVRAAIAVSVCCGLVALVTGLMSFFDIESRVTPRSLGTRPAALARQRGRPR